VATRLIVSSPRVLRRPAVTAEFSLGLAVAAEIDALMTGLYLY
jgi:hypothetical protein